MAGRETQKGLTGAIGVAGPQLIALVGAGGKTTALQLIAGELATSPRGVIATTTTAMFAAQLSALGHLLLEDEHDMPLPARAGEALRDGGAVALAKRAADGGKIAGLAPATVDALWRAGIADSIVVEADGSRGLPLKAFGTAEPQVPFSATVIVVVAGLDVLGQPLDAKHVHRAELLATALGVTRKTRVTQDLLSGALALQVVRVRQATPASRVVVLLNKAESDALMARGEAAGEDLLAAAVGGCGQQASGRPDRVVVGSLLRGMYRVLEG